MNIDEKIFQYKEFNLIFSYLYNTVVTVCNYVKPIYSKVEPYKYFEYFFKEIDFDKIDNFDNEPTKTESLKYLNAIYWGLEQILKNDIAYEINNYQSNISKLSKEQIQKTQIELIELIGQLKIQAPTNKDLMSFTGRYNELYKRYKVTEYFTIAEYHVLIANYIDTIINYLLNSFEIINETFKEITPLIKSPQQTDNEKLKINDFFKNIDIEKVKIIQSEFKNFNGKKMSILIYLLQSYFKILTLIHNSKTQSRKHFIRLLKENENITNTQSIDKNFLPNTDNIIHSNTDADYINIKEQLNKIISS